MAIFVQDAFTEATDVVLTAHTGEVGATWAIPGGGADMLRILAANDCLQPVATGTTSPKYYASGIPAGVGYTVKGKINIKASSASDGAVGVTGRMDTAADTMYVARHNTNPATDVWQLYKFVSGTATLLGEYAQTLTVATPYEVTLDITDASKRLLVDGVERIVSIDNAITAAGRAGLRWYLAAANQANLTLDDFVAEDAGGGGPTLITASDTISSTLSDSSANLLLSGLADSLSCSVADVAQSISVVLSAADTVAAAIAESSTALVGVSVTDSVTAAITEAVSCFGTVAAADGLNLSTAEAVQLLCALAASDSVSMSTAEGLVAIASVVQVSDALGVSVADATVAVLALLARSDALDVSVAEAITLLGTINRSDSFNLSVSDQSQLAVLLQALDALAVSVTDDAARQAIGQVVARLSAKLSVYPTLSAEPGHYPTLSGNPGVNDA